MNRYLNILLLPIMLLCCNWQSIDKFSFITSNNEYKGTIEIFKKDNFIIDVNNIYASFPNKYYEFGVNSEIRFWTFDTVMITIDSLKFKHFYKDTDISDSEKVEDNKSFPIKLPQIKNGVINKLFSIKYFINNDDINLKIDDKILVNIKIYFKIENQSFALDKDLVKIYHNLSGVVVP